MPDAFPAPVPPPAGFSKYSAVMSTGRPGAPAYAWRMTFAIASFTQSPTSATAHSPNPAACAKASTARRAGETAAVSLVVSIRSGSTACGAAPRVSSEWVGRVSDMIALRVRAAEFRGLGW